MSAADLSAQLCHLLTPIYPLERLNAHGLADVQALAQALIERMGLTQAQLAQAPVPHRNHWDQRRCVLITYANTLVREGEAPLQTLKRFVDERAADTVSDVHLLPFFPYSSDDGFSVMDYSSVNPTHGAWADVAALAESKGLMFDVVINHCSARSLWFEHFVQGQGKGHDFFKTASPEDDLSAVVRPRTSPLLNAVQTASGERHVWCTFSHDQVDFDFANPEVLLEFAGIMADYLRKGASLFRLDAVAFLWKEQGTPCINHPFTHDLIRVYRLLIERAKPEAIIITETNIPNAENLQYFGNANEAHAIYNFALPPLLLHTLIEGNSAAMRRWLMTMPPAQNGTTYFNFIASHDGIGLRPVEGLLDEAQVTRMVEACMARGGRISWRARAGQDPSPYEINIALFDALSGTTGQADAWAVARMVCAHAVMLGLEGIPGLYIHSLLATPNDFDKLENTGQNRAINRHQWHADALEAALSDEARPHRAVFEALSQLIRLRAQQPAFHPNATQFTLQLGDACLGFWRQSMDRQQSIFCISNVSAETQTLRVSDINLIAMHDWRDLIGGQALSAQQSELVLTPYQTVWLSNR